MPTVQGIKVAKKMGAEGEKKENRTKSPSGLPTSQCKENGTLFGHGAFKEVAKLQCGPVGRALSQCDWCPHSKGGLGHRQRDDRVRTR